MTALQAYLHSSQVQQLARAARRALAQTVACLCLCRRLIYSTSKSKEAAANSEISTALFNAECNTPCIHMDRKHTFGRFLILVQDCIVHPIICTCHLNSMPNVPGREP